MVTALVPAPASEVIPRPERPAAEVLLVLVLVLVLVLLFEPLVVYVEVPYKVLSD